MAQSLGRKLRRGNAVAYKNGQGKVEFIIKTKFWLYDKITPNVLKNRIKNEDLSVCNMKPIVNNK